MSTIDDIIEFSSPIAGTYKIGPDTDVFQDLGMVGDDFHDMIEKFTERFSVDMTDYRWYFHADEEGGWWSVGRIFYKPPYERVKRIPVTPVMLTRFANKGKWDLSYSEHHIPQKRYDVLLNRVLLAFTMMLLIGALVKKYFY